MGNTANARSSFGTISALLLGVTLFGAANCGEETDSVETVRGEITGGWTNLTLINGWQNYWGTSNAPAVGIVNGVITFRGALKATSPTSNVAFVLPAAFRPVEATDLRCVMSGGVGGTLNYNLNTYEVTIWQDGVSPAGLGAAAKAMTSLDGVSVDKDAGSNVLDGSARGWLPLYTFRLYDQDRGSYVKLVDGFVRFQGFLWNDPNNLDGFLVNIPSSFRPGQTVFVAANLGGRSGSLQSWGQLSIYPDGNVYVNGNPYAANASVSFEGVSFSRTNSGNINLPLVNNWVAYSARTVKVGKYGDVVRLQGAIKDGTSTTFATLPVGYRPPKTAYLVAGASGPVPARLIVNPTNGNISFDGPPLNIAALMLSLDGVSFGL
jgi:hypothetical protein